MSSADEKRKKSWTKFSWRIRGEKVGGIIGTSSIYSCYGIHSCWQSIVLPNLTWIKFAPKKIIIRSTVKVGLHFLTFSSFWLYRASGQTVQCTSFNRTMAQQMRMNGPKNQFENHQMFCANLLWNLSMTFPWIEKLCILSSSLDGGSCGSILLVGKFQHSWFTNAWVCVMQKMRTSRDRNQWDSHMEGSNPMIPSEWAERPMYSMCWN